MYVSILHDRATVSIVILRLWLLNYSSVVGDGRNDSPEHSAQYCTYTSMEHNTGRILDVQVLDKRELGGNSSAMEKEGLVRSLHFLQSQELQVVELVTDAHASIAATMSEYVLALLNQAK